MKNSSIANFTWLGAIDADWTNPDNWSGNVAPGTAHNVVIPDATTTDFDPIIVGSLSVNQITINSGGVLEGGSGTLTLTQLSNLTSGSSWENNGSFNPGTSTIIIGSASNSQTSTLPSEQTCQMAINQN